MSLAQSYILASKVRSKLTSDATNPKASLRNLVVQANMLDNLMDHIASENTKRVERINQVKFDLPNKQTQPSNLGTNSPITKVQEYEVNDDSDSDFDSDSDSDSDYEPYEYGIGKDDEDGYDSDDYYYSSEEEEEEVDEEEEEEEDDEKPVIPSFKLSTIEEEPEMPELSKSSSATDESDNEDDAHHEYEYNYPHKIDGIDHVKQPLMSGDKSITGSLFEHPQLQQQQLPQLPQQPTHHRDYYHHHRHDAIHSMSEVF